MTVNIVLSEDGSITCREAQCGELYHNRAGAYTEALYNYVKPCDIAARIRKQNKVVVLDSCFGLGYNSFVFIDYLLQDQKHYALGQPLTCHIIGIDKDKEIINLLSEVLAQEQFKFLCTRLNINVPMTKHMISSLHHTGSYNFNLQNKLPLSITLEMRFADLRQTIVELLSLHQKVDYIFHDGFSPRSMPELWTVDLFKQYTKLLSDSGRIITYSSAYAVRGALRECGLAVRKTLAIGGKSGGTIGFKDNQSEIADNESIFFLSKQENDRLSTRSSIPYRDPELNDARACIVRRRDEEIRQSKLPTYTSDHNS